VSGGTVLNSRTSSPFAILAKPLLEDSQLRKNLRHATDVIGAKRDAVVAELPDWQALREAGRALRQHTIENLAFYLEQFEANFTRAGGVLHWARDAEEARRITIALVKDAVGRGDTASAIAGHLAGEPAGTHPGAEEGSGCPLRGEVIKIKSMTTEEIQLNKALEDAGVHPYETDLAELIIQLGGDAPSHIVVPALHKNRQQVREIFKREMQLDDLGDTPQDLADAARKFLREKFLRVQTAVSGANFLIAETGGVCVVESEGNGRMCLTLPETLITIAGIDKVIPRFADLEVLLQLVPRSATGERMNPYNSVWTGVHEGDGPRQFHLVLLDNGRSDVLADEVGRQTLNCIRCGACQNVCPVYRQTGGHAYGSVYAGPIGAILTPQLQKLESAQSLPFASTLCGACYEVCPVKINIPEVLVHLRNEISGEKKSAWTDPEAFAMAAMAKVFTSERRFQAAQRLGRLAETALVHDDGTGVRWISWLPGLLGGWTQVRDLREMPKETFRDWWRKRKGNGGNHAS
jgi:L-lactate dehydrogenase complex protein LldF